MSNDSVGVRRGPLAWYEGEPRPPAALDLAFAELWVRVTALEDEPENEALHDACAEKLAQVASLTGELELDTQIRKKARHHVVETARWLEAMPVARERRVES